MRRPSRAAAQPGRGRTPEAEAALDEAFAEHARQALHSRLPADHYRPLTGRRRWLLAAAGVAMACLLAWLLTERPGKQDIDPRLLQADSQRCAPGQTQDCVGGRAQVILVPAMPAFAVPASAPRR